MEEDGAKNFPLMKGCRFATNAIIARYKMIVSLLEEEQEIESKQSEPSQDATVGHENVVEEPMYEIAVIENPNRPKH